MRTAERLELSAELAEQVAESGADEMKALYLLTQREMSQAASSGGSKPPLESEQYAQAAGEGRDMKSHYEASLQLHRMTGGGPKTKDGHDSGPLATSLNPNRHVMMIHGRPVMVLSVHGTSNL